MLRLLLLIALLALLSPLFVDWPVGGNPLSPTVAGRDVVIETRDLEVRFERGGPVSDTYMLFGGLDGEVRNGISNVFVAGLPIRHARFIAERYPKFHLCSSPGAAQAQQLTEDLALVAANGSTRRVLKKALAQHRKGLESGGERTCLRIRGEQISLRSAKVRNGGHELTRQLAEGYRESDFYFVSGAELTPCEPLL